MAPILGALAVLAALVATASARCDSILHMVPQTLGGEQPIFSGSGNYTTGVQANQRCRFQIRCPSGNVLLRLVHTTEDHLIVLQNSSGFELHSSNGGIENYGSENPNIDIVYNTGPSSSGLGFQGHYTCRASICDGISIDVPPVDHNIAPIASAVTTLGFTPTQPMPVNFCEGGVLCPAGSFIRYSALNSTADIEVVYKSHKGVTTISGPQTDYSVDTYIGRVQYQAIRTHAGRDYTGQFMQTQVSCVTGTCTFPTAGATMTTPTGSIEGVALPTSGSNEFCAWKIQCSTGATAVQLHSRSFGVAPANVAVCTDDDAVQCFTATNSIPHNAFLLPGNLVVTEEANLDARFTLNYTCVPSLCPAQDAPQSMARILGEGTHVLPGGLKGTSCHWQVICPMDKPHAHIAANSSAYRIRSDASIDTWAVTSGMYMPVPASMWTAPSTNYLDWTEVVITCLPSQCTAPNSSRTDAITPAVGGTTIAFPAAPSLGTDCPWVFNCPVEYGATSMRLAFPAGGDWTYGGFATVAEVIAIINTTTYNPIHTSGAAQVVVQNTSGGLFWEGAHASALSFTVDCGTGLDAATFVATGGASAFSAASSLASTSTAAASTTAASTTAAITTAAVGGVESGASALGMPLLAAALAALLFI